MTKKHVKYFYLPGKAWYDNVIDWMKNSEVHDIEFKVPKDKDLKDNDTAYYYIISLTGQTMDHAFDNVPISVMEKVSIGKIKFLFVISSEYFGPWVINLYLTEDLETCYTQLNQILKYHNIPLEYTGWFSSSINNRYNLLNFNFVNQFIFSARQYMIRDYMQNQNKKIHHYLCQNRQIKENRIIMVRKLFYADILDKGIVSLGVPGEHYDYNLEHSQSLYQNEKDNYYEFYKTLPLVIDDCYNTGVFWNAIDYEQEKEIYDRYTSCCFDIVGETYYVYDYNFITEKTTKPIMFKMPFMVVSNPGYLKCLRNLGFVTFPELFDESYDEEPDLEKRTDIIASNAKKLCSLTVEELEKKISQIQYKLDYNFNHLLALSSNMLSIAEEGLKKIYKKPKEKLEEKLEEKPTVDVSETLEMDVLSYRKKMLSNRKQAKSMK